jgi:DNA polymerase III sliding clamp (beta) subunit (PCNA family)
MLAGNLSRAEREKYVFIKETLEKQLNNLSLITRSLEGQGADATRVIPQKKLEEVLQSVIDTGDISANYPLNLNITPGN